MIDERKNVQTTPSRTYCKRSRPLSYSNPNKQDALALEVYPAPSRHPTTPGGDRSVLLNLYRSLVRSKLDYGSIVYGSARKSYLKCLDTIHHQGLRLALGAFRTSPVESLYAESNEPSLYTRREKLSLQYTTKLAANPKNPAHN